MYITVYLEGQWRGAVMTEPSTVRKILSIICITASTTPVIEPGYRAVKTVSVMLVELCKDSFTSKRYRGRGPLSPSMSSGIARGL